MDFITVVADLSHTLKVLRNKLLSPSLVRATNSRSQPGLKQFRLMTWFKTVQTDYSRSGGFLTYIPD